MKWLISAATVLIALEKCAHATSSFPPMYKTAACFVGNIPSPPTPTHQKANRMDANSYLSIGKRLSMYDAFPREKTAVSMGIRSILGLGKNNKDENDEKSENPEDIKLALEAIKRDLEAVTAEERKKSKAPPPKNKVKAEVKVKIPEVKKKKKINPVMPKKEIEPTSADTYGESVRDRINRVKSGHMTDEEKAAFLNSALTRTPPGSNGPPIRQEIPFAGDSSQRGSSSATPFPKDALWNTLVSNSQPSSSVKNSSRYGNLNLSGNNDSAKREYLDMVTNPDRFKSYAAMGGYRSSSASNKGADAKSSPNPTGNVVENLNMLDITNNEETEGDDLASRLEVAAIQKEKQDAEAKAKKEEEERARKAQFEEEQRKRREEMRRDEEKKAAVKRKAEEEKLHAQRSAIEAEEKRLADMQTAQDAYWANKLEEENSRKEKFLSEEEKRSREEIRRLEAEARLANAAREAAKKAEIEMMRAKERARQDPHESEILKEAAEDELHERERNADIIEQSSAFISNTVPQQREDDVSSNAFVQQQEKKKAALDEFMKEQNDRLASLNSPLPFMPKIGKQGNAKSVSSKGAPQSTMPRLNLTDLTMKKNKDETGKPEPRPVSPVPSPPPPPAPRLNLADLTMAKKPSSPAPADSSTRLSLAEMTMLKKPQTGGVPPSTPSRKKTSSSPSSGSKPIRQNIPISTDDDDEDDFFEYSRGGGNSGMSIKDIMARENSSASSENKKPNAAKAQSKMWGIDIDKFTD